MNLKLSDSINRHELRCRLLYSEEYSAMEGAEAVGNDAAPPHPSPEVIVISDDDVSEDNEEVPITNDLKPFSWTDVADRLLTLAKNRELRDDQQALGTLLHDLGIPPSIVVRRSLRATSEKFGELLTLLHGHDRRFRASEDLVMVVCEVLSLAQTAPYQTQAKQEHWKEESALVAGDNYAIDQLYQLMDHWQSLVVELARCSEYRACAVGVIMSRLEKMSAHCTHEIENIQDAMVKYENEMQSAAERFVAIMADCRAETEKQWFDADELELRVFEDTYNKTSDEQSTYYENCKALNSLEHRALELELRRNFFQAALTQVCVTTQLVAAHDNDELLETTTGERINALGSDILENMDNFCEALKAITALNIHGQSDLVGSSQEVDFARSTEQEHRPELLRFAKHLEQFWLIHQNWLPPMLLDVVIERFDMLSESNGHSTCPVANAISRVCGSLRAGYSK
ncbi:hypothetical protein AM587_10017534 [Phytophthora nicotianae]|uniref:Uncharacterized protein n=3 Tax=Phytophthora nicotianae TaxID=4792 RepID=A0A0W8C8T7_PHYNI|nr:hypothetical protein AM587_10017534 [Phytophthora nicotianae]